MRTSSQTDGDILGASFRDPAGFVFHDAKGTIYRQVNKVGAADFDQFLESGLYKALTDAGQLVPHRKVAITKALSADAHAVIQPERIPFITYPFEWSFSQLKDAALLTLAIQKKAMRHGMCLKDATAYNVQFKDGRPVFIDTLSFESYKPGTPWQAYRQFCQHFLAPLALATYTDVRLTQLLRVYPDGVPLDLAAKLLPGRTKARLSLAMHIHLHARAQQAKSQERQRPQRAVRAESLRAILESLERAVARLEPQRTATEWGDYYDNTNYTASAADQKAKLLTAFVKPLKVESVLDLGGNNGRYSRVLNKLDIATVCADIDPNAVEANYRYVKKHKEQAMLPVLLDLTNPGGGLGWANDERAVVAERLHTDLVMALAIIHHLAISNNLPLERVAAYFAQFAPYLIIEFVPKEDSQVQTLLATRADIFPDYNHQGFEAAFTKHYKLVEKQSIKGTKRTLYLFKRKGNA